MTAPLRYRIEDRILVAAIEGRVSLWAPVIPETPFQRIVDFEVVGSGPSRILREREFGNAILHALLIPESGGKQVLRLRYEIERLPVPLMLDPACAKPLGDPAAFARHLAAERFVVVDEATRSLANEIIGSEANPLTQARRIYDYVTGKMTYDAAQQSWTGSSVHALTCSVGNCNDIHALFISLARSIGIPARLVLGQALEPPPPGQDVCELCGYHCWAEFFCRGIGWIPVDASCACKYGKHALFGGLEMNHIAWSVGRDIRLEPAQQGEPLLFFAGPYAEVDGRAHTNVARHIGFEQIG
ncbi:MAG: transglutaminase family protein [Pseudomonadota bacterium]